MWVFNLLYLVIILHIFYLADYDQRNHASWLISREPQNS